MGQITGGFKTIFLHSYKSNHNYISCSYEWPPRLDLLLDLPQTDHEAEERHGWNPTDLSPNMFIKDDDALTVHRHPVPMSTDGVRGRTGFSCGLHVWEINWTSWHRGTSAVVGVGTDRAPLHGIGYQPLVGSNSESWGWDIRQNKLYHNSRNKPVGTYPTFVSETGTGFTVKDKFLVILDMDEGTLSFMESGSFLGRAFDGLKGLTLYPMVSAVWGHSEITMKYIGGLDPGPLSLKELCRRVIRRQLQKYKSDGVLSLPLPNALKLYLDYK